MRKIYRILAIVLVCIITAGILSCNEPYRSFGVSPRSLEFKVLGGSQTVYVVGDNWELITEDEWIQTKVVNDKITVTVGINNTKKVRHGSIIIKTPYDSKTVKVKQNMSQAILAGGTM